MNGLWLVRGPLLEMDYGSSFGLQPVIRNSENRRYQTRTICIPDLNNIAICRTICDGEPVGSGRENLTRYLDGLTKRKFGSLVPLICHQGARCTQRTKQH